MTDPVDREVVYHGTQPGGEAPPRIGLRDVTTESCKVILAQRLTDAREDIHHIIGIACIASDCREDEPAIAPDEDVPRGLGRAAHERTDPGFHTDPSSMRGAAGCRRAPSIAAMPVTGKQFSARSIAMRLRVPTAAAENLDYHESPHSWWGRECRDWRDYGVSTL